jgi:hypothetical protein
MCSSSSHPLLLRIVRAILSSTWFFAFPPSVDAQINIVDSGATGSQVALGADYTESFDSLIHPTTDGPPWNDNSTLPGWYAYRRFARINEYIVSPGLVLDLGSLGDRGATDRALGCWVGEYAGDYIHFGVRFVNASSSSITALDLSFDGEQWYYGDRLPGVTDFLEFSYRICDAGQGNLGAASDWVSVPGLAFVSPINDTQPTRRFLKGNLPANRTGGIAESLTELTLAPGQEIWFRWTSIDTPSIQDGVLAIDNLKVRFSVVPEPTTYVALAGAFALLTALCRRRRRAQLPVTAGILEPGGAQAENSRIPIRFFILRYFSMCALSIHFRRLRIMRAIFCSACFFAFVRPAEAQINIVDSGAAGNQIPLGANYTQSFDSLIHPTTGRVPWSDNSTVAGWYVNRRFVSIDVYMVSFGLIPDLGSLGGERETDRALGSWVGQYAGDYIHFGVRFVNTSSSSITGLDISFDGEQWYYGEGRPGVTDFLEFSYRVCNAGQGDIGAVSDWVSVPDLAFVSPIDATQPMRRSLNGNLPVNRTSGIAESLTELTLAPGQEIWLRWTATDTPSILDGVLAIDNLSVRFTAVPEPAAFVVLAGASALLCSVCRRRRRAELS